MFFILSPFGLSELSIIFEILLTVLLPVIFITFEKTAIIMQDPFENIPTDTPMTTICNNIEKNINEMIGETNHQIASNEKATYYLN